MSDQRPLPLEPVGVVVRLRNDGEEALRLETDEAWLQVAGEQPDGSTGWQGYAPDFEPRLLPPDPSQILPIGPRQQRAWARWLDWDSYFRRHAFSRPGAYAVRAKVGPFVSPTVNVLIREPVGADRKAYEYLLTGDVARLLTEHAAYYGIYTPQTLSALDAFARKFPASQYGGLARLCQAAGWLHGVEEKKDPRKALAILQGMRARPRDSLFRRVEYHLGFAYEKLGDQDKALEHYTLAMKGNVDRYVEFLNLVYKGF